MADEINFMDLACVLRITNDTTLEKFGSAINASTFDAANLAGSLKQKSLIDFSSYYPGPNTIVIADAGKALMMEADTKAAEPFDDLDQEILFQVSGGKRIPLELQNTLNLRSKDLALRLYKLYKQGLVTYELKSGTVDLQLTEAGFLKAKASPKAQAQPSQMQPKPQMAQQPAQATPAPAQPAMQQPMPKPKGNTMLYAAIIVVVVILLVLIYAAMTGIV